MSDEQDAMRYRWLRDQTRWVGLQWGAPRPTRWAEFEKGRGDGDKLDAAIDAAMRAADAKTSVQPADNATEQMKKEHKAEAI